MIKNISNSHPNVFIENKQIKQVYECKTLGVKTDQHLSWKGNTDEICKKVTAGISAIRRIRPFVDQVTLVTPPARRAWRSYKFASLRFSVLFSVSQVGLPLMGVTAVHSCLSHDF